MSKHTPGPWRVEQGTMLVWGACDEYDNSTYGMGYPVTEAITRLGHPSPFSREYREEEAIANARLIAAAPILYEALEKIANGDGYYGAQAAEYKALARAALAAVTPPPSR